MVPDHFFFENLHIDISGRFFNILQIVVLSFGSRGDPSGPFLGMVMVKVVKWSE